MYKWIIKVVKRRVRRVKQTKRQRKIGLQLHGETARTLVHSRLEHFNKFYNFSYKRVFIKSQSTRWGSCSSKGNLNFNYRIALLPSHLADYIIVHELCHLKEFNHGKSFWDLVAETIENPLALKTELNKVKINSLLSSISSARLKL